MWYFTHHLSGAFSFIAPRAPLQADPAGFGWLIVKPGTNPPISQFHEAAEGINLNLPRWLNLSGNQENDPLFVMGFSQGAAVGLVYTLLYPNQVEKTACLAGFLPDNSESLIIPGSLTRKQFFVAHGSEDEIVPIQKAKDLTSFLSAHGAIVTFCEDAIGHKVGASCYGAIARFFNPPV